MGRSEDKIARTGLAGQIIVRPEAEQEVQQAFVWYQEQSEGLGLEFLRSIEACLFGITRNPFAYAVAKVPNVRRALVRRFPYTLFYPADDDAIVLIAVFNVKRQSIDRTERV